MTISEIVRSSGFKTKRVVAGVYKINIDGVEYTIQNLNRWTSDKLNNPWVTTDSMEKYYAEDPTKTDALYCLLYDLGKLQ